MESIYGGSGFPDDPQALDVPLDRQGLLVCAKRGETVKDSNGGQWFVTLAPEGAPHLPEGTHVVFGRVVKGFEVLKRIEEEVKTDDEWRPSRPVTVLASGELVKVAKKKYDPVVEPVRSRSRNRSGSSSSSSSSSSAASARSRSRSRSVSSSTSTEDARRRHRRHKKHHRRHRDEDRKKRSSKKKRGRRDASKDEDREETLEELDAR